MKFRPIKYKQPTDGGDARCALYALCNLFDDGGFLLYNNVGESTNHNKEVEILRKYADVSENVKRLGVSSIYPHAITPPELPIPYGEEYTAFGSNGVYVPVLLDGATERPDVYHTVLVLWGNDDCIVIDSKKDFPEVVSPETIFRKVRVHGFRPLTLGEIDNEGWVHLAQLSPEQLPHIFDVSDLLEVIDDETINTDNGPVNVLNRAEFCKEHPATASELRESFKPIHCRHEIPWMDNCDERAREYHDETVHPLCFDKN